MSLDALVQASRARSQGYEKCTFLEKSAVARCTTPCHVSVSLFLSGENNQVEVYVAFGPRHVLFLNDFGSVLFVSTETVVI